MAESRHRMTLRLHTPASPRTAVQQLQRVLGDATQQHQQQHKQLSSAPTATTNKTAKMEAREEITKRHALRTPSTSKSKKLAAGGGGTTSPPKDKARDGVGCDGVIVNFRKAKGLPNIFRCAKTDELAELPAVDPASSSRLAPADQILLYHAGLILDLRSAAEISHSKVDQWTRTAPGGSIHCIRGGENFSSEEIASHPRCLVQLDVLGAKAFASFVEQQWLTSAKEQLQMVYFKALDTESLQRMRIAAINKHGVFGLNQAILESGKSCLCQALQAITIHLEKKKKEGDRNHATYRAVVIHCAQGKDRTGILVMLLQSLLGVDDKHIIDDYHASEARVRFYGTAKKTREGELDRTMMKAAPRLAMAKTLQYLRDKYGSISPGYLQNIGFDDSWRVRLMTVLLLEMEDPTKIHKRHNCRL